MANYNNGKFIGEAIESVINQTYSNWELIIVDDFSSDGSLAVISRYLDNNKIKLFNHDKNYGYASALRTAMDKVSGEIIGILDSDDAIAVGALGVVVDVYKKGNFGFVYSDYYKCYGDLIPKDLSGWVKQIEDGNSDLIDARVSHFKTFKKSCYYLTEGFNTELKNAVDRDIVYKLEEVTKFKFIDKPLYYYRTHCGGISQGKNVIRANIYDLFAKYNAYKRRLKTNMPNLSNKDMSNLFLDGIFLCVKSGQWRNSVFFGFLAVYLYPMNIKGYGTFIFRMLKFFPYRICKKFE